jgi:hypothetical protein
MPRLKTATVFKDKEAQPMFANTKEEAKHVIDLLPKEATLDDIMHALYLSAKFQRGEREIREGKGVDDEAARERLEKWSK